MIKKMERDDIEYFLDKYVVIFCNNGFRYNGTVKNIGSSCLLLDDRFKGMMTVAFDTIDTIRENKDGR